MKILFLNLPFHFKISRASRWPEKTKSGTFYYPYWLAYAAGASRQQGFEVKLIDAVANGWDDQKTLENILSFNPEILIAEIITPTVNYDLKFFEFCKKNGFKGKIIAAGTHATVFPKEMLNECPSLDCVAFNEYDDTVPELAENLNSLEKVLGIAWRKDGKIIMNNPRPPIEDLDRLPFVSKIYKEFLDCNNYAYSLAQRPMIQILSSRGCPNQCTFCSYPQTMEGRLYRQRSPENFTAELEYIAKELPQIKEIFIEDDTFTVNKKRVIQICDLIIGKGLKICWSCNVRADVSFEVLDKMKKAGCRLLVVGYESGNQEILNNVKKGITLKQSFEFSENAKKLDLKTFGCFMIGLPGETQTTIWETFDFAKKTNSDMVFFQQAIPFPGTEFYNWVKKNNYIKTKNFNDWLNKQGQLKFLVNYPGLSAEDMEKNRDAMMIKYYFSLGYIWKTFAKNRNFSEMKRILSGALDYFVFLIKKYAGL